MKYCVSAQITGQNDHAAGHESAASVLADIRQLAATGADHIQIFDTRTGRLIDEAALRRADAQDQLMMSRRAPVRPNL